MINSDKMAASTSRPGDRTFFIYDHWATKKEYDDPKDAIVYYFPQHTAIAIQCIFCNQLMGMVSCTKGIAGSPPKLYKLRRNKVATLHEGNFTLALTTKLKTPDSAIIRKLENLYRVFAFYHCSIARVKQISGSHENFLTNMASIWDFYVPHVRRYGNAVPAIFEPIPTVKLSKGGNVLFLRCSHLLQWLKAQHSLLAGCIFYKRNVLCTQLTPELTSHLLLIKPNQLHHPSKSITDTVLPFGVRIMSVYVTKQQYDQLSKPLLVLTQPRKPAQAKPETIFCTPPASPTKMQNASTSGEATKTKRTFKREISTTAGRLFSNFTGMLEGTVVESLWPSASKSGSSSKSELSTNSVDSLPRLTKEASGDELTLSRSSEDVVRTLQFQEIPGELNSTGIPCCNDIITDSQDTSNSLNHSQNPPENLSTAEASNDSLHCQKSERQVDLSEASCTENESSKIEFSPSFSTSEDTLEGKTNLTREDLAKTKSEQENGRLQLNDENTIGQIPTDDITIDSEKPDDHVQRKDLDVDILTESRDSLEQRNNFQENSEIEEPKSESPESGIGDCSLNINQEALNESKSKEKEIISEEGFQETSAESRNGAELICVNGIPNHEISHGRNQEIYLCGGVKSECNTVLPVSEDLPNTDNFMASENPNTVHTNSLLENGDNSTCSNSSQSPTTKNFGVSNSEPVNTCNAGNETVTNEENSQHSIDVADLMIEDERSPLIEREARKSNPDILQNSNMELRISPDVLQSAAKRGAEVNWEIVTSTEDVKSVSQCANSAVSCNYQNGLILTTDEDDLQKVALSTEPQSQNKQKVCQNDQNKNTEVILEPTSESTEFTSATERPERSNFEEPNNDLSEEMHTEEREFQVSESFQGNMSLDHTAEDCDSTISADRTVISPSSKKKLTRTDNFQSLDHTAEDCDSTISAERTVILPSSKKKLTRTDNFPDKDKLENCQETEGSLEMNISESNDLRTRHLASGEESKMEQEVENVRQNSGESFDLGGPGNDEERSEDPMFEAQFAPMENNSESVKDLVSVSMYVQAHSDTTLLFLAEKSISKEKDTLFHLWQSVLKELGELELHLKNVVKPEKELDCKGAFNFIHYDKQNHSLEGSITNPINQAESIFCRACQVTHEQFVGDQSLTDITLRNHQTVVYAHRNACHHTFFHRNVKTIPVPGIPSRDDMGFYIQESSHDVIREHSINLL